jgi:ankyrin repeat protein
MGSTDFVSCIRQDFSRMCSTEGISSKSLLMTLPNELFFEVASHFEGFKDLNSLVRTSRFFHGMFNTHLYRRAVAADDIILDDILGWVLSGDRLASLTLLLDHGLSVNHTGKFSGQWDEEPMLRFLCKPASSVPLARLLIQRGASMELKDVWPGRSETVIYRAIAYNNCEIAALLLAHGADLSAVNNWGKTPLHLASDCVGNIAEMIHLLIAYGADIEARCETGDTPLLLASQHNHNIVATLLEHGADAGVHNHNGETPLHWAARRLEDQHELAKSLLEHGAIVNARDVTGETPLHWISGWGRDCGAFMAKFLLENGADVNAISNHGFSPLHWALSRNCGEDAIALLLEHGAIVNATDPRGRAPLHWLLGSSVRDGLPKVELLLENGADVNAISNDGFSPLHYAAVSRDHGEDVVALLLEHGAIVNATDQIGRTPLHWLPESSARDKLLKAKLLLENGADVNAISNDGLSPLQHALGFEHKEDLIALLLEYGADVSVLDSEERRLLSELTQAGEETSE